MAGGDDDGGDGTQDDFFDQILSTHPSAWGDLGTGGKSPWEIAVGVEDLDAFDESALLVSRLRQHQIGGENPVMLQLTDLQRQGLGGEESGGTGFSPLPLFTDRWPPQSREEKDGGFKSPNGTVGSFFIVVLSLPFLTSLVEFSVDMDSFCEGAFVHAGRLAVKKSKAEKDPNKPKRPASAFYVFM
ncbi:transcription factor bHLH82 [Hordeum vulgare]|nr:transcription factor bHLH82 [Hordeum vulgare]